jgi:hypothetical protein
MLQQEANCPMSYVYKRIKLEVNENIGASAQAKAYSERQLGLLGQPR